MELKNKEMNAQQEILPEHQLVDSSYLARMLNINRKAVYRICSSRKIEYYKIGKLLYFHQKAIDVYLQKCKVNTTICIVLSFCRFMIDCGNVSGVMV